ncbi:MAG: hypothetical protein ABI593_04335 [Betaproteobacteria bacterium]
MELRSLTLLLVVAVAIAVAALVFWYLRSRRRNHLPPPIPDPVSDEEDYLDSSHIGGPIAGMTAGKRDAAARAAAALHAKDGPRG